MDVVIRRVTDVIALEEYIKNAIINVGISAVRGGGYRYFENGKQPTLARRLVKRSTMQTFKVGLASMLKASLDERKALRTGKLLYTQYRYTMSPQKTIAYFGGTVAAPTLPTAFMSLGYGPGLYWNVNSDVSSPNGLLNMVQPINIRNPNCSSVLCSYGPIYVFVADWPFGAMMYGLLTPTVSWQSSTTVVTARTDVNTLQYEVDTIVATDDANTPILYNEIAYSNKDWSVMRHYVTIHYFDMVNFYPAPMTVEILFFKFIVDPDTMSYYEKQCSPLSFQNDMQSYGEQSIKNFGTKQIKVVKRKRIVIPGINNWCYMPTNTVSAAAECLTASVDTPNQYKCQFKIKRMYDVKKPIQRTGEAVTLTEQGFFDSFYDHENGIYCRMQAWQPNGIPMIQVTGADNKTIIYQTSIQSENNDYATPTQSFKPSCVVQVNMRKQSFIKLDSPILRGPFRT